LDVLVLGFKKGGKDMWDVLSFNHFVTQDFLIFFYYVGAIVIPILLLFFRGYLIDNISFLQKIDRKFKSFFLSLKARQKVVTVLGLILLFICMEFCWRVMFEVMIGYFDMHNYLYDLSKGRLQ
jgi:hypothetical protein